MQNCFDYFHEGLNYSVEAWLRECVGIVISVVEKRSSVVSAEDDEIFSSYIQICNNGYCVSWQEDEPPTVQYL